MSAENTPSEINTVIKEYVSNGSLEDWKYGNLASDLYNAEEILRFYFFQPKSDGDYIMPQSVIGFEKTHVNILAYYSLLPDSVGLKYRITFNTVHLARPIWSLYETLLHEMTHLYVENNPDLPQHAKGHGKLFTAWCEEMGLHPRVGTGVHWKAADGQFERLMDRWGVERPKEADVVVPKDKPKDNWWDFGTVKPKGSSTLTLYTCEQCSKRPICKIRAGRKDLSISCDDCDGKFQPTVNLKPTL